MTLQQKYESLLIKSPRTHFVYVSKEVITSGARKEIKREVKFDEDGDPILSIAKKTSQSAMSRQGFFPYEGFSAQDKLRNKLLSELANTKVKAGAKAEKKATRRKNKDNENVQGI